MPKLDLKRALAVKGQGGNIEALKGPGFTWSGFSPSVLFAGGAPGDAWIPTREWCYTQTSGGIYERVTTSGDAVARQIGVVNGIYSDQLTDTCRPKYIEGDGRSWLLYDGLDDFLVTPPIDFTATDKMAVFAGVQRQRNATEILVELGSTFTPNGFAIYFNPNSSLAFAGHNGAGYINRSSPTSVPKPLTQVLSMQIDFSGDTRDTELLLGRINGADALAGTEGGYVNGAGPFRSSSIFRGRRNGSSFPFHGRDYGTIVVGDMPSIQAYRFAEDYINNLTGAY